MAQCRLPQTSTEQPAGKSEPSASLTEERENTAYLDGLDCVSEGEEQSEYFVETDVWFKVSPSGQKRGVLSGFDEDHDIVVWNWWTQRGQDFEAKYWKSLEL